MQKIRILFDKNKYCRARVTFSLNALMGRKKAAVQGAGSIHMEGKWDPRNAYDLMKYTASKGYKIDSYELGKLGCLKNRVSSPILVPLTYTGWVQETSFVEVGWLLK